MHPPTPIPTHVPTHAAMPVLLLVTSTQDAQARAGAAAAEAIHLHNMITARHRASDTERAAMRPPPFVAGDRPSSLHADEYGTTHAHLMSISLEEMTTRGHTLVADPIRVVGTIVIGRKTMSNAVNDARKALRRRFPEAGSIGAFETEAGFRLHSVIFGRGDHICTRQPLQVTTLIGLCLEFLRHSAREKGLQEAWTCPTWFRQRPWHDGENDLTGLAEAILDAYAGMDPRAAARMRRVASLARLIAEGLGISPQERKAMQPVFLLHEISEQFCPERLHAFGDRRHRLEEDTHAFTIQHFLLGIHRSLGGYFLRGASGSGAWTSSPGQWPLPAAIIGGARLVEALIHSNHGRGVSLEELALALPSFAGTLLDGRVCGAFERLLDKRLPDVIAALDLPERKTPPRLDTCASSRTIRSAA